MEILQLTEHPTCGNSETGMQVFCIAKKTREEFVDAETWKKIADGTLWSRSSTKNELHEQQQILVP